ncbi:hypothetical protein AT6N2_C2025 [Agrobacterium tumefaciens]|nr:hypothetical protein AT6N2_C2025 [Agrobacterium tumefaciens]
MRTSRFPSSASLQRLKRKGGQPFGKRLGKRGGPTRAGLRREQEVRAIWLPH